VRARIRILIENEKPTAILSDDHLSMMLRGEGIDVARRTVAKYREAMRIPTSAQRRRDKR
jgi:RNA polymerase sigma-54 factor